MTSFIALTLHIWRALIRFQQELGDPGPRSRPRGQRSSSQSRSSDECVGRHDGRNARVSLRSRDLLSDSNCKGSVIDCVSATRFSAPDPTF